MSSRPKILRDRWNEVMEVSFRGEIFTRNDAAQSSREIYFSRTYVLKFCSVQCPSEQAVWARMNKEDRKYFAAIIAYGEDWTIQKRVRDWEERELWEEWAEQSGDLESLADQYGYISDFKLAQYVFCSKRKRFLCVDYATNW